MTTTTAAPFAPAVVVEIDQTALAAADVFMRMSMDALVADVRGLDSRVFFRTDGASRAARELEVLNEVERRARLHSHAGGFFVYRGGNHVAVCPRSGADRAIMFTAR